MWKYFNLFIFKNPDDRCGQSLQLYGQSSNFISVRHKFWQPKCNVNGIVRVFPNEQVFHRVVEVVCLAIKYGVVFDVPSGRPFTLTHNSRPADETAMMSSPCSLVKVFAAS